MEQPAIRILNLHRIMAVSTVRPDGWPQTTFVGYANEGWTVYFLIFRSSQKLANIAQDNRIAMAIGAEPTELAELQAVYASARANQVSDPKQQEHAWRLLMQRHPNLGGFQLPAASEAVMMRADCEHVSVLDYTQGLGHAEALMVDLA